MKFRLLSDLHLEFHEDYREFVVPVLPNEQETVLLLAGDIHVGIAGRMFVEEMCERHRNVFYVLGNHEFYKHTLNRVRDDWRVMANNSLPENFALVDNDVYTIDNYRILGGTLWTNFNRGDYWAMLYAKRGMNDFDVIEFIEGDRKRRFLPQDALRLHDATVAFLTQELKQPWDGKTVVMTHHLPHPLCVHERFKGDVLNDAYMSNLDDLIYDHNIDLWVHGHTHDNVDFNIHGTQIVCNPRGYHGKVTNPGFNPNLTIDL
jgi:predicted phosphodiesterase